MRSETGRRAAPPQRGMVTAELAMGVLAAIMLLACLCWAVAVAVLQLRCLDTAAEVARQAARDDHRAMAQAQHDAPAGAEVRVTEAADRVVVTVRLRASPGGLQLPPVSLQARAETLKEPR